MSANSSPAAAPRPRRSAAMRRYQLRFWPAMIAYAVVLVTVIELFKTHPPQGMLRYVAAVAPAVPILGVIAILALYLIEEADEFQRTKAVLSMLWGLAFVLAVTTVWGFLEVLAGAPHIPLYFVFPLYCMGMGVSQPFIAWRYR